MLKDSGTAVLAIALAFVVGLFVGYLFGEGKFRIDFDLPNTPTEDSTVEPPVPPASSAAVQPPAAEAPPLTEAQIPAPAVDENKLGEPLKWLAHAALNGNPRAEYALALDLKNGRDGIEGNAGQAVAWMRRAAGKLAVAQRTLGVWCEKGDGVEKDIAKARAWYERAANNGDYQAMHNLGYFYAHGLGGLPADTNTAVRWFKAAADRGLVASQVNLAILYSQLNQNDQAYLYSKIAAKRDPSDKDAPRMRDTFGQMLPPDVKAKMDEAAEKWKPIPIDVIANGGFDTSPEAFAPNAKRVPLSTEEFKSVQELLADQGFKPGAADGRPSDQTTTAIRDFQKQYGLPITGVADKNLLAALESVPR